MYKYVEKTFEELKNQNVIVYGTGVFGRRCINCLKVEGIKPIACSDSNSDRWGLLFCDINIISPAEIDVITDLFVIVAIENFLAPFTSLVRLKGGIKLEYFTMIKSILRVR